MSYGISVNYYKHPLYEVLEDARNLLFNEAKQNRNTIACRLRKHSGSSYTIMLNKSDKNLKTRFEELVEIAVEENMVSATAHKLRENSVLWQSTDGDKKRLEAFFKKMMGFGEKKSKQDQYLEKVKDILEILLNIDIKKKMNENIYSMLRIAKFINGEEVKDE
jgi:CRISPR-associated protein Cmr2